MSNNFAIIETNEDGVKCVAVIPEKWLISENVAVWPPGPNITSLVKRLADPLPNWTSFSCLVLKTRICEFFFQTKFYPLFLLLSEIMSFPYY
jgi:hypothetical protein